MVIVEEAKASSNVAAENTSEAPEDAEAVSDDAPETNKKQYADPPKGPPNYEKVGENDVAFFRFGYLDYMKLNTESMIQKFEEGVWYSVDLYVDWDQ